MAETTTETPVVTTAIIPAQRVFRKAREVLKARLIEVNPKVAELNLNDFTAKVDTDALEITLATIANPSAQYDLSNVPPLSYQAYDLEAFVFVTLNFAREYKVEQKDQVIAAIPEGLTITLGQEDAEGTVEGIVTLDPQVTDIQFADSITPASLFLKAGNDPVVIRFLKDKDPIIDLTDYIVGGDLGKIAPEDLVEPITASDEAA